LPRRRAFWGYFAASPSQAMWKYWRHAILGIGLLAALLTPSGDAFSMFAIGLPMVFLYFLSILLVGRIEAQMLDIGSAVRIIREPYFGRLGTVVELPPELMEIESGTHARVLKAKLDDGTVAVVPRANVEIIVEE